MGFNVQHQPKFVSYCVMKDKEGIQGFILILW